jgi:hypothetical protein
MIQIVMITAALMALPALNSPADGGGGVFWGEQRAGYPFLPDTAIENNSMGLAYVGGYGYGIHDRRITGGFGYVIHDGDPENGTAGGFGGVIGGIALVRRPVSLSLISWTGIGGLCTAAQRAAGEDGWFLLSEAITLELGVPVTRWLMPSVYAGYQVIGNLAPGEPFSEFFTYSPVVGFRVAWGRFY